MNSYKLHRDENAVLEHDGGHRRTHHWPLAARAWPIAEREVPAETFIRLTAEQTDPTRGNNPLVIVARLLFGAIAGWHNARGGLNGRASVSRWRW